MLYIERIIFIGAGAGDRFIGAGDRFLGADDRFLGAGACYMSGSV